MGLFNWAESRIQNFRWFDISLIKLTTCMFTLLIAKLWPPILTLHWCFYFFIAVLAAIRPMYMMLRKNKTK